MRGDGGVEQAGEGLAGPVARGPVALGDLRRVRDDALLHGAGSAVVRHGVASSPSAESSVRNLALGLRQLRLGTGPLDDPGPGVDAHRAPGDLGAADRDRPLAVAVGVAPADEAGVEAAGELLELLDGRAGGVRRLPAHGGRGVQRLGELQRGRRGVAQRALDAGAEVPQGRRSG